MRKFSTAISIVAVLLWCTCIISQLYAQQANPNYKFVQFQVEQLKSLEDARSIDASLRSQTGVLTSRTDHRSKILLCIFDADTNISESTFVNWLNNLGFQIDCYREGIHGVDIILAREDFVCN